MSSDFTPRAGLTLVAKHAHAYTGPKQGFLSFAAGEEFVLIAAGNSEWWSARCIASGAIGFVPINYLMLPRPAAPLVGVDACLKEVAAAIAHLTARRQAAKTGAPQPRASNASLTGRPAAPPPPAPPSATATATAAVNLGTWGSEPWFRGDMTKSAAVRELDAKPPGTFLIREKPCDKAGEPLLCLSVKARDGPVQHLKVVRIKSGHTIVGGSLPPQPSLPALLAAYRAVDVTPECGPLGAPCVADGPLDAPLSREEHVAFIDGQIARIHSEASGAGGMYTITQHATLQNLIRQRQELANSSHAPRAPQPQAAQPSTPRMRPAPVAPVASVPVLRAASPDASNPFAVAAEPAGQRRASAASGETSPEQLRRGSGSKHTRRAPPAPGSGTRGAFGGSSGGADDPRLLLPDLAQLSSGLDPALVQRVREETGISFEQARKKQTNLFAPLLLDAASAIYHAVRASSDGPVAGGADLQRLQVVIFELTEMKNDAQQRSWSIYDDSDIIKEFLDEFITLVECADPVSVLHLVRTYQSVGQVGRYEIVETLVVYYQMEVRTALRRTLLRLFTALGGMDAAIYCVLQNSVLALELARDVQVPPTADDVPAAELRLASLRLLVGLVTCGLAPPAALLGVLNTRFAEFLLHLMADNAADEPLVDTAVDLMLSLNRHFDAPVCGQPGDIMAALTTAPCTVFSEKTVLLANRGVDPVPVCGALPAPHSVFKFLADVFASKATGESFFFTNDLRVLVEVLIRELADRDAGDPLRAAYLCVLGRLLANSQYAESPHRAADVRKCLVAVRDEENYEARADIAALKADAGLIVANFKLVN